MTSAAILKAVKLLRNYCQITVRLPPDYNAIIWHSQELRSGKAGRWASPPSRIPFVAVGRDGACGHRGPARGENESVDRLSTKTSRGRALPWLDVRTRHHSRSVSSRTPLHDTHWQFGRGPCRSHLFGETLQEAGGLLAHRASQPLAFYRRSTKRAVRARARRSPAGRTAAPADGGGASPAGRKTPPLSTPWGKRLLSRKASGKPADE
jgi:hypothetical protein